MSIEKKQTQEKNKAIGNEELGKANLNRNSEVSSNEQEKVLGGGLAPGGLIFPVDTCDHPRKYKTGQQREDSRWLFLSQHQFEYYCPDCKKTVWIDEEP